MERWYDIIDYKDIDNDRYKISDRGRCIKCSGGTNYVLRAHKNKRGGYLCVSLYSTTSQKTRYVCIHTLMKYYIMGIKDTTFVNHKDGDKTNNDLSNLELSSPLHNTHHAIDNALFKARKNTDEEIDSIRTLVENNPMRYGLKDLSILFDKTSSSISRIVRGVIRKDVPMIDLYCNLDTHENRIGYLKEKILDHFNDSKSITKTGLKFRVDYYTVKNIIYEEINNRKPIQ